MRPRPCPFLLSDLGGDLDPELDLDLESLCFLSPLPIVMNRFVVSSFSYLSFISELLGFGVAVINLRVSSLDLDPMWRCSRFLLEPESELLPLELSELDELEDEDDEEDDERDLRFFFWGVLDRLPRSCCFCASLSNFKRTA